MNNLNFNAKLHLEHIDVPQTEHQEIDGVQGTVQVGQNLGTNNIIVDIPGSTQSDLIGLVTIGIIVVVIIAGSQHKKKNQSSAKQGIIAYSPNGYNGTSKHVITGTESKTEFSVEPIANGDYKATLEIWLRYPKSLDNEVLELSANNVLFEDDDLHTGKVLGHTIQHWLKSNGSMLEAETSFEIELSDSQQLSGRKRFSYEYSHDGNWNVVLPFSMQEYGEIEELNINS